MRSNGQDEFEDLLAQTLAGIEQEGVEGPLASMCAKYPEHAALLRERVASLSALGLVGISTPTVAMGKTVGGYEIVRRLGGGGMGVVYLVRQPKLNRLVALKTLPPYLSENPAAKSRMRREIRAVGVLRHPGLLPVHEVGETDGVPYFTMDYVEGQTLAQALAALQALGKSPTEVTPGDVLTIFNREEPGRYLAVVCDLVARLADAVAVAHANGILHRDVKPSNILLDGSGQPLLFDFGLAHLVDHDRMTRTGDFVGTPHYVSPEQALGKPVDARTDVYALGVVLYELLTFRLPFTVETGAAVLHQVATREPTPPNQINRRLSKDIAAICMTALSKRPERRYGSAQALADDLRRYTRGELVYARAIPTWARLVRLVGRYPGRSAAVAAAALGVIGFGVARYELGRRAEHAATLVRFVEGLVARADFEELGRDASAADLLLYAAEVLPRELADYPEDQGRILMRLSAVLAGLSYHEQASKYLERARDLLVDAHGPNHTDVGAVWNHLGNEMQLVGRGDAEGAYRKALAASLACGDGEHPTYLLNLAGLLERSGRQPEARRLLDQLIGEGEALRPADRMNAELRLGWLDYHASQTRSALDRCALVLAFNEEPNVIRAAALELVVAAELRLGRVAAAREHGLARIELLRSLFREESVQVAAALYDLALVERFANSPEAGLRFLEEALRLCRAAVPGKPDHPWIARIEIMLGVALVGLGRIEEGRFHVDSGLERDEASSDSSDWNATVRAWGLLARARIAAADARPAPEVAAMFEDARAVLTRHADARDFRLVEFLGAEAAWRRSTADLAHLSEADRLLERAAEVLNGLGIDDARLGSVLRDRAAGLDALGEVEAAERMRADAAAAFAR